METAKLEIANQTVAFIAGIFQLAVEAPMLEKGVPEDLKVEKLISVYRKEDKMWLRASITDLYCTLGRCKQKNYRIKSLKISEFKLTA